MYRYNSAHNRLNHCVLLPLSSDLLPSFSLNTDVWINIEMQGQSFDTVILNILCLKDSHWVSLRLKHEFSYRTSLSSRWGKCVTQDFKQNVKLCTSTVCQNLFVSSWGWETSWTELQQTMSSIPKGCTSSSSTIAKINVFFKAILLHLHQKRKFRFITGLMIKEGKHSLLSLHFPSVYKKENLWLC